MVNELLRGVDFITPISPLEIGGNILGNEFIREPQQKQIKILNLYCLIAPRSTGCGLSKLRCTVDENAEIIEAQAVDAIELTVGLVSAYLSNNHLQPGEIATLIANTHAALVGLSNGAAPEAPAVDKPTPSQIRKSITPDSLISFVDGKPYKTLKRHLGKSGMTIEQYRERYGLPRDYPSTAASYSEQRSALARSLGLGQQRKKAAPKAAEPAETVSEKPRRAPGRPRKAKEATKD